MSKESFFLVRHGRSMRGRSMEDELTPEGIQQARKAGGELLAKGLGASALILSSTAPRAIQTANIIGEELHTSVLQSTRIRLGGLEPQAIKDLDKWVNKALAEAKVPTDSDRPLVLVTHAPLIAIAKGLHPSEADEVDHGEIFEYHVGSWVNSRYSTLSEVRAEDELRTQG